MNTYLPHQLGKQAEDAACKYLQEQGLQFKTRNYHCRLGEIDIIMLDKDMLVFVEVRMRSNQTYISGIETITRKKQLKIIKTANYFLLENNLHYKIACRFDVVGVEYQNNHWIFQWIKDAFIT